MASLTLHIGTRKTGTTFLQHTLADSREVLAEQGVTYPVMSRQPTHTRLIFTFLASKGDGPRRRAYNVLDQGAALAEIDAQLAQEVEPGSRWLMSSETAARLTEPEMTAMLEFLGKYFDSVRVIVYFRRQEFLIESFYSQLVKVGRTQKMNWDADYATFSGRSLLGIYEQWVGALGADAVTARPYLESFKSNSAALLADFCSHTGIDVQPPAAEDTTTRRANPRLSAEGIEFLVALNSFLPHPFDANDAELKIRRALLDRIMAVTAGPPLQIPGRLVPEVKAHFGPDNQRLAELAGGGPEWEEWLEQSPPADVLDEPPALRPERVVEILRALSHPEGPLDLKQEDWGSTAINEPPKRRRPAFLR